MRAYLNATVRIGTLVNTLFVTDMTLFMYILPLNIDRKYQLRTYLKRFLKILYVSMFEVERGRSSAVDGTNPK